MPQSAGRVVLGGTLKIGIQTVKEETNCESIPLWGFLNTKTFQILLSLTLKRVRSLLVMKVNMADVVQNQSLAERLSEHFQLKLTVLLQLMCCY